MISGLLLRLMPEGFARRCIKPIAGLYILAVVFSALPQTLPALPAFSAQSYPVVQPEELFRDKILCSGAAQLEAYYQKQLAVDAVEIELLSQEQQVVVQTVTVVTAQPLADTRSATLIQQLQQELMPQRIIFKTKDQADETCEVG